MKRFLLEVRVCGTGRIHDAVRFVSFSVSERVAREICGAAVAKQGRNIRRRGDVPTVRLDECAVWLDGDFNSVRPMLLPDLPSIVTVQNDGSFKLMNYFRPAMVCSERVLVQEMMDAVAMDQPGHVVHLAAQQELHPTV